MAGHSPQASGSRRLISDKHLEEWGEVVPWDEKTQLLLDLVLSRVLVEIFSDEFLRSMLRFRGGTALNKIHFPEPYRYSEDIDLVRTTKGPIKPIIHTMRRLLEPWLGRADYKKSRLCPGLLYDLGVLNDAGSDMRLKIEINFHEIVAHDPPIELPYRMDHSWFSGSVSIPTLSIEEVLASKLRALLQRDKGRDLFDMDHALNAVEGLNVPRLLELFRIHCEKYGKKISRAQAHANMFDKLEEPEVILADLETVLPKATMKVTNEKTVLAAFKRVLDAYVDQLPGKPWAHYYARKDEHGLN